MTHELASSDLSDEESTRQTDLDTEIRHVAELIEVRRANLQLLEEQLASYGLLEVPLQLRNSVEFERERLRELVERLDALPARSGAPSIPGIPRRHNLPPRPPAFVNRQDELNTLLKSLRSRYYIVAIEGIGGIGKTALALEAAYGCLETGLFSGVVWCAGLSELSLDGVIATIAEVLDRPDLLRKPWDERQTDVLRLFQSDRYLLILDNLETMKGLAQLQSFLKNLPAPSKVLVTSRHHYDLDARVIRLRGLGKEETLLFIRHEAERRGLTSIAKVSEIQLVDIFRATGGHPLAIQLILGQAAAFGYSIEGVLSRFSLVPGEYLSGLFESSWRLLSESARNVLTLTPFFGETFSKSQIEEISPIQGRVLDGALDELRRVSLLEIEDAQSGTERRFRVHHLALGYALRQLSGRLDLDVAAAERAAPSVLNFKRQWRIAATMDEDEAAVADSTDKIVSQVCQAVGTPCRNEATTTWQNWRAYLLDTSLLFQGTKLPDQLPLLFLRSRHLSRRDASGLPHLLRAVLRAQSQVAIVLAVTEPDLEMATDLIDRTGQAYACDFIVMNEDDLLRIAVAQDPGRALRHLVLSRIDLLTVSPFTITGPATDAMFFGREPELRQITEHARSMSYAVIGGRRIGKTSILGRLHRVRLPAAGFHAFYYQCQHLPEAEPTRQQVLDAVTHEWLPDLIGFKPSSFADIVTQLPRDKALVFLIDEVDRLVRADQAAEWPLFGEFRALAETGRCQFVFAGERTLREAMKRGKSPLFNFASAIVVGCLDLPAVEELVTRPMKQLEIELAEEAGIVQRIWDATSGHPNVVQRLCQRLILRLNERRDRRLTSDDVEAVVVDPAFQRDDFYDVYLEQATVLERILPLVLAQDGSEAYTLSDICRLLDVRLKSIGPDAKKPHAADLDSALRRLTDLRAILNYTPNGFTFAVGAFPQIIGRWGQVTVEDELMILVEKYRDYGDLTEDEIEQKERER